MVRQLEITAELKEWSLDDEHMNVEGTIFRSMDLKFYPDGERMTFLGITFIHYPQSAKADEYWLIRTNIGLYFKLLKADMQ